MKIILLLLSFLFGAPFVFGQQVSYKDSTITEQFDNNLNEWEQ